MGVRKKRCTEMTDGIIKDVKSKGLDFPTIITVEYQVDGICYEVKESIKLKSKAIKIGFLPIGQEKTPRMGETRVGYSASVTYNPDNPAESYITYNTGKANI